jgi:hypothetical protein
LRCTDHGKPLAGDLAVPFFEISLDTANKFYEWGWRASIAGALITAIGVILLMYGTRVRDHETESQLSSERLLTAQTSEKAAALQVRAEELKGDNLKLSARISELQTQQEYANVARYGALGLLGVAGAGLKETSPLNDIIGPYLHDVPNDFNWECTAEAMRAYAAAIELDSKFPFPYLYRATCNQANNGDWQGDLETARSIFLITTQIPGHNLQHDQFLKFIETGHFKVLQRGILGPARAPP